MNNSKADLPTQPTLNKGGVGGRFSFRRKQMLAWYRTSNKSKFDDNNYRNWMVMVGENNNMKDAIYKASEDQLDDLYILREELRLGI
jgi:hypothetical protein